MSQKSISTCFLCKLPLKKEKATAQVEIWEVRVHTLCAIKYKIAPELFPDPRAYWCMLHARGLLMSRRNYRENEISILDNKRIYSKYIGKNKLGVRG